MTDPPPRHDGRWRHWTACALGTYWTAWFIATHVPVPQVDLPPNVTDKTIHWVAYGGLAFLFCVWRSARRPLSLVSYTAMAGTLALYAAIEELLQIPVGRHGDFADWVADMGGAGCGFAIYATARYLQHQLRRRD